MISGIGEVTTFPVTCAADKSEPKTVFVCRALKARAKEKMAGDAAIGSDQKEIKVSVVDVVLGGVVEIQNGDKKITEINEALLDTIPFDVLAEVASVVLQKSFLSEGEAKN